MRAKRAGEQCMTWSTIAHYLAANWLEIAGVLTTLFGIWLTTRRLLICWPVVLVCRCDLPGGLLSRAALFRCAAADLLCGLHALWLVALVARRARRGRGTGSSAAIVRSLLTGLGGGRGGRRLLLGWLMVQHSGAALPSSGCGADQLQPGGQLVAGAQAHRQLVALDRGGPGLHWRVSLQRSEAHGSALLGSWWLWPCWACATGGARQTASYIAA